MKPLSFILLCSFFFFNFLNLCGATTVPVITVLSPVAVSSNGASDGSFEGKSPIHYVAYAISPDCISGIASMKIYTGSGIVAFQTFSSYLDVQLPLKPNSYQTVVKAWDNCGGLSSVRIADTVTSSTGQMIASVPISNLPYAPQTITYLAQAKTTCPKGVASVGIYTSPHHKVFGEAGNSLDGGVTLGTGTYDTVVEEWDNCGGASSTPIKVVIDDNGLPPGPYQFAYMPDVSMGTVQSFWVSPTSCALNPVLGNPSPAHFHPIAVVKNYPYLFVLNRDTQDISIYLTDDSVNGGLTQVPHSPFSLHEAAGYAPTGMVVPSSGSVLSIYVTNASSDGSQGGTVSEFNFNLNTGQFTEIAGSPLKLNGNVQPTAIFKGPQDLNDGNWLYTANGSSISVLGGASTGAVSEIVGSPFAAPGRFGSSAGVKDITVLLNGLNSPFIYTANSENSISGFQVGSRGQLIQLPGSPFLNPDNSGNKVGNPASLALSPSSSDGQTVKLYTLNSGSEDIGVFAVNLGTGIPTYLRSEQQGRVLATSTDRLRIGVQNSPQQCLVTSNGYSMSIDSSAGDTSLVPGSPFLAPGNYPSIDLQLF